MQIETQNTQGLSIPCPTEFYPVLDVTALVVNISFFKRLYLCILSGKSTLLLVIRPTALCHVQTAE